MSEFDWMDAPPTRAEQRAQKIDEEQLAWLLDDPKLPVTKEVAAARVRDPEYAELARVTRKFSSRQQQFLKAMVANQMVPTRAIRAVQNATGVPVCWKSVSRWTKLPAFRSALEKYAKLALQMSGVESPASILLRTNAIVEDALTPVARFHDGRQLRHDDGTPAMEVDRSSALKGLDLLARSQGLLNKSETQTSRVTVILDFSGEVKQGEQADEKENQVLDGEFTEVKK